MKINPYLSTIFLSFIWGLYIVLSRVAVQQIPLFAVGFFSRLVAVAGLSIWVIGKGEIKNLLGMKKRQIYLLLLIGFFAFLLDASSFLGLRFSTATKGSLLLRTDIIFILIFSYFFLGERFKKIEWMSMGFMIAGALLVMNINLKEFHLTSWGDAMFIVSAFLIVCNAFIIKLKLREIPDTTIAFYNNLVATSFYSLVFFLGGYSSMLVTGLERFPYLTYILIAMGICDVFLFVTYYHSLRNLPVWVVRTLLLLIPLWSILLGSIFLGEALNIYQSIGMILLLGGAAGIIITRKKPEILVFNSQKVERLEEKYVWRKKFSPVRVGKV